MVSIINCTELTVHFFLLYALHFSYFYSLFLLYTVVKENNISYAFSLSQSSFP